MSNVRQIRLLEQTLAGGLGVRRTETAISGVSFARIEDSGASTIGSPFDASARYRHSCVLQGKVYCTDGMHIWVFDPAKNTLKRLESINSGAVPEGAQILEPYRVRLVATGIEGFPYSVRGSRVGNTSDWDPQPPVLSGLQAFDTQLLGFAATPTRVVGFAPYFDDLGILFCDPGIYRVTGDPAPGANGQRDTISDSLGGSFGRAWAFGPHGELFFWASQGRLMFMSPGGMPESLTKRRLDKVFEDIDLEQFFVKMAWNTKHEGLDIAFCPYGDVDAIGRRFFWESTTNAFHEDLYDDPDHSPVDLIVIDGNSPQDSRILVGCRDGVVRTYDDLGETDDGAPVKWDVLIGPVAFGDSRFETKVHALQCLLDWQGADVSVDVLVSETAGGPRRLVHTYTLRPGLTPRLSARARGGFVWFGLRGTSPFAFEALRVMVEAGSFRRVRASA